MKQKSLLVTQVAALPPDDVPGSLPHTGEHFWALLQSYLRLYPAPGPHVAVL